MQANLVSLFLLALAWTASSNVNAQQTNFNQSTIHGNQAIQVPQAPQAASASALQAHLNSMQVQAQRQIGHLNGLVLNAVNGTGYSNVLEAISNVGKVIHQQLSSVTNPNHVNIMTAPSGSNSPSELANSKKNEYQSIVITDQGTSLAPSVQDQQLLPAATNQSRVIVGSFNQPVINYREQGEILRQDIVKRAAQLQQVVASSMDLLKNNGDLIVRRLLEQMNVRLDQAKAKADRIINEPATNEVALKALSTINLGLNNLNNIISNIVNRLDQANKDNNQYQVGSLGGAAISQRVQTASGNQLGQNLPHLLDSNKFRTNLQQLGQQFQSALNNSQLHQQLAALRQRQQQQMNLLKLPSR